MWDVNEGLHPQINTIDSTPGFTGRIAIEQVREDILKLLGSPMTGDKLFQLILQQEAVGVIANLITLIIID